MSRAASVNPFVYVAATPKGGRTFGLRQARSERALAEHLRRDRLVLLRTWKLPAALASPPRLTLRDQVEINSQLSMLLGRGVPLVESLEVTATVVSPGMQPIVERMRELVAGGSSFAEACRKVGVFDTITISVYQAAERTGDLGGSAAQLAKTARRQQAIKGKAGTVMLYPVIVLSIAFVVVVGLLMFIVPRIGEALENLGDIPVYTEVLVTVGVFLREQWVWALAGLLGVVTLLVAFRKQLLRGANVLGRRLPALRDVMLTQESARFFSVMAALTHSGVPLADALGVAIGAVRHPRLHGQLKTLRARLVEGGVLHALIDRVDALPLATRRLLMAAERAGDLDAAFDGLARDMADELDVKTSRLMALMEPAVIVMLFLVIGSMVLALMLPMLTMSDSALGG